MRKEIESFARELSTRYRLDQEEENHIVRCLIQGANEPNPKTFHTPKGPSYNRVHRVCGALARYRQTALPLNRLRREVNEFLHSVRTGTRAVL